MTGRLLLGGVLLLLAYQAQALFNPFAVMQSQTKSERKLTEIAAEITELGQSAEGAARLDARAERLFKQGRGVWERSPANSDKALSIRAKAGYEAAILVEAMADYYALTGRSGLAIPILIDAIEESKRLRYYKEWRELTLQLVRSYQHLGMVDHADARLDELLQFMRRFGFTLEKFPVDMNMDAVVFARLHAMRLEIRPDHYRNPQQVADLFRFYRQTVEATPQSWGWDPRVGFRFAEHVAPFVHWFAAHGDEEQFEQAVAVFEAIRGRNLATNPFVLSNELGTNMVDSQLGLDTYVHGGFRSLAQPDELMGTVYALPPKLRRYAALDALRGALDLAEAERLAGRFDAGYAEVTRARAEVPKVEEFYRQLDPEYRLLDRFPLELMRLTKVEAQILEGLGRWQEALTRFEEYIAWSEEERASLPIDERQHFFRGQAREAYLGAIRALAEIYSASSADRSLSNLLNGIERLKARQFQEALGVDRGEVEIALSGLRDRLGENEGILLIQDAETELLTILISREKVLFARAEKTSGWDEWIFELRNLLAEDIEYDEEAFAELGAQVLGPLAEGISPLRRLLVVTDGALSALPPSILQYSPGKLLDDERSLALIPSLSLWLAGTGGAERERERSLFVVADPIFEEKKRESSIGRQMLATRGSNSLKYFQRLPETLDEGRSITASFSASSKLLAGEEAVESAVKHEPLARYSHLHFATHGIISNDLPGFTEPALVLGYEEGEDGFLFASEVAQLDLDAELTVLSACNTGNGEYFNGEGLMGMGRAFMLAGSKSVIVSLWPVESLSTQKLMEYLYELMGEGMDVELALWTAQRRLRGEIAAGETGARGVSVESSDTPPSSSPEPAVQQKTPVNTDPGQAPDDAQYSNPYFWSPFLLISAG